jgi:multiple sugar transport system substrate-binding protein
MFELHDVCPERGVQRPHRGRPSTRTVRAGRAARWGAVAVAGMLLAACGSSGGNNSGSQGGDSGTITFVNAQDPGTFDKVIAGFEKANPKIKVKQQVVPGADLNSTLQSRLSSKDATIDLYEVDEPRLASRA